MMNRRWFFTAAGGAFLTAACSVVRQPREAAPTSPPAPKDAGKHFQSLIDWYFIGLDDQIKEMLEKDENDISDQQLPRKPEDRRARLQPLLETIYRPRFDFRLEKNELPDDKYKLRLHQACVLGQLTGLAFAYESGALGDPDHFSFEKPVENPKLGERHLEWARDAYGLYTNSKTDKRKTGDVKTRRIPPRPINLCGEPGGPGGPPRVQIDEACPFCLA